MINQFSAFINSYQYDNKFSAGIGVGLESFDYTTAPLFVDFRYYTGNSKFTPFFYTQLGYSIPLRKKDSDDVTNFGGTLINPGVGLRIEFENNSAILFNIAYRYQHIKSERKQIDWWMGEYTVQQHHYYNRLSVGISFLFY